MVAVDRRRDRVHSGPQASRIERVAALHRREACECSGLPVLAIVG
jgi:hypothetical protein